MQQQQQLQYVNRQNAPQKQSKVISFEYLIFLFARTKKKNECEMNAIHILPTVFFFVNNFFLCMKCSLTVDRFIFFFCDNHHATNFIRLTASQSF